MQPKRKKSKQDLVPSKEIDERESQQRRTLEAGYLLGNPLGARNTHIATTHYVIHPKLSYIGLME